MTKFLLIEHFSAAAMGEWNPADVRAYLEFQQALTATLMENGELVDAQGVAEPAKRVTSDGLIDKINTGPFGTPLLAGYRIVDVESAERAVEIAAQASAAPGPGGVPLEQPIDVRELMVPELKKIIS